MVTANPPYIPLDAFESVDAEARDHDPDVALWSGEDGLDAIRVVAHVAARLLVDGGLVLCEHADVQEESAPRCSSGTGSWSEVRDHLDLAGRPRFVTARRVARPDRGHGWHHRPVSRRATRAAGDAANSEGGPKREALSLFDLNDPAQRMEGFARPRTRSTAAAWS